MASLNPDVLGIKIGTWTDYRSVLTHGTVNTDTLYFITDKGIIYRGTTLVTPRKVVDCTLTGSGASQTATITFDDFSDPEHVTQVSAIVYTKEAIDIALRTLNTAISEHAGTFATDETLGHVYLSDDIDSDLDADDGHTAATPKAVKTAIQQLEQQIGNLAGAMVFKGTIGAASAYSSSSTYAVGDYCEHSSKLYRCTTAIAEPESWTAGHWTEISRTVSALPASPSRGDTYRVVAPGTYDGTACEVGDLIICTDPADTTATPPVAAQWTVAQNNIDGAVTANADLDQDTLVLGNGGRTVKKMATGSPGNFLKRGANGPVWDNHLNVDHGMGYATAQSESSDGFQWSTAPNVLLGFKRVDGAVFAIRFFGANMAYGATLDIQNTGATQLYWQNLPVAAGTVKNGDTAIIMAQLASGTTWKYHILAIDRSLPTALSQLTNDIQGIGVCSTEANTAAKTVTITGVTIAAGSVFAVRFTYAVVANATLAVNNGTAKNIMHRGSALTANQIASGDLATFLDDGTSYHLLGIDRKIDPTPTLNSDNLVTSGGVYAAIESAKLKWQPIS